MQNPTNLEVIQNAWVVKDVEAAARRWSKLFGIGPFFIAEYGAPLLEDIEYRGSPAALRMKTAIAYAGALQIELIEPLSDGPNVYRDTVPVGEENFHHICVWSSDIDRDIDRYAGHGCVAATTGKMQGGPRFAYVDAQSELGCYVELLEESASVRKVFAKFAAVCAEWDGKDPIRHL